MTPLQWVIGAGVFAAELALWVAWPVLGGGSRGRPVFGWAGSQRPPRWL